MEQFQNTSSSQMISRAEISPNQPIEISQPISEPKKGKWWKWLIVLIILILLTGVGDVIYNIFLR